MFGPEKIRGQGYCIINGTDLGKNLFLETEELS
jgi:hypothetical protein